MNSKLILIAVVVVLALIAVGGYLYITMNQRFSQNVQSLPKSSTPAKQIDTTTDILKDLEKIPSDASVDKTMESFDKTIQSF